MEKKKILYVGNKLGNKGHTATAIDVLAPQLLKEGFEVIAVSDKRIKAQRMLEMLQTVWKHRKSTNVVIIDTYSTLNFYYAHVVAKLCRRLVIPYIPVLHGGNLPARIKKSPVKAKKLFGNALVNIAPSHYLLEAFKNVGFNNTVHIPNTIELAKYSFVQRKTIQPKLLWVRSFATIYNPGLALDILSELRHKGYDATLTMVGPAKDESFELCKNRAQKEALPVTFTGMLSKEKWISLSAQHDVFINTTNFDNTPVSVIEAMALGLPVVSTNVGGLPYLIENDIDGMLVPPKDPQLFVMCIETLLKQQNVAQKIIQNARKKAEQFDWQVVKHQWISLLHQ